MKADAEQPLNHQLFPFWIHLYLVASSKYSIFNILLLKPYQKSWWAYSECASVAKISSPHKTDIFDFAKKSNWRKGIGENELILPQELPKSHPFVCCEIGLVYSDTHLDGWHDSFLALIKGNPPFLQLAQQGNSLLCFGRRSLFWGGTYKVTPFQPTFHGLITNQCTVCAVLGCQEKRKHFENKYRERIPTLLQLLGFTRPQCYLEEG